MTHLEESGDPSIEHPLLDFGSYPTAISQHLAGMLKLEGSL